VTVSVDQIVFKKEASVDEKMRIRGLTIFVGTSSMECKLVVDQIHNGEWNMILDCYFTMVALNKETNKPALVTPIMPETENEKILYELGKQNKIMKKLHSQTHLFIKPPLPEEISLLHDTFLAFRKKEQIDEETGNRRKDYITPDETRLQNNMWMHPQFKNIHNKIFGGFLMKSAFELAFITATMYSTDPSKINFLYLDEIHFIEPVSIGDVVTFGSKVVYTTKDNVIHVRVKAEVLIPGGNHKRKTTNLFHFAFKVPQMLATLYPKTYKDGIYYLDAKRRHVKMLAHMERQKVDKQCLF
jgi:acyl-coenzyme A thioesterase 9